LSVILLGVVIVVARVARRADRARENRKPRVEDFDELQPFRIKPTATSRPGVPPVKPTCPPDTIVGSAYVIDGDTIIIKNTRIRLFGIDAPELDHPYGIKSKWAMVKLCKGQIVRAIPDGSMSHDRCVAKCYLPDGRDLSEELVKAGLAIDWPKFSGGVYRRFEPEGVRKKLWRAHNRQTGRPVPPPRPRA
tara:strand:- start:318 stop:890 length:573 start_codon:yes stop_codon:yes gene_type:complete